MARVLGSRRWAGEALQGRAGTRPEVFVGLALLGALVLAAVAGCGGSPMARPPGPPSVELQGAPTATYDPSTGKTSVVVDFLVRAQDGSPVDPASAGLRRLVNGQPVDVESVPDFRDTRLATNLRLGLVLDASYSMLTSSPPAFDPMKAAAAKTLADVRKSFASWNSGSFASSVTWFEDQYVCAPAADLPDDAVLDLPKPTAGSSTRLYAATAWSVDRMKAAYDAASQHGPGDHWALVLFTDGRDNYSFFDSSGAAPRSVTVRGGSFICGGTAPVSRDDLLARLTAFPELTLYVIGLGGDTDADALRSLAQAGRGRFVSNPDPGSVSTLFGDIAREFTTLRRDGVTMPLPPGEYAYAEEVTVGGATARITFKFRAGDGSAGVMNGTVQVR